MGLEFWRCCQRNIQSKEPGLYLYCLCQLQCFPTGHYQLWLHQVGAKISNDFSFASVSIYKFCSMRKSKHSVYRCICRNYFFPSMEYTGQCAVKSKPDLSLQIIRKLSGYAH